MHIIAHAAILIDTRYPPGGCTLLYSTLITPAGHRPLLSLLLLPIIGPWLEITWVRFVPAMEFGITCGLHSWLEITRREVQLRGYQFASILSPPSPHTPRVQGSCRSGNKNGIERKRKTNNLSNHVLSIFRTLPTASLVLRHRCDLYPHEALIRCDGSLEWAVSPVHMGPATRNWTPVHAVLPQARCTAAAVNPESHRWWYHYNRAECRSHRRVIDNQAGAYMIVLPYLGKDAPKRGWW